MGGWEKRGVTANDFGVSFWTDENILKLIVIMVAQFYDDTKTHWIVHFKWVSWMVYELYLNNAVKR